MNLLESSPLPKVLVTGAAGFIGYHLAHRLLNLGQAVDGVDNLSPYYEPSLKQARLDRLGTHPGFVFHRLDLSDRDGVAALFAQGGYDIVLHLAAQAGVRYSVEHPMAYLDSNLAGMLTVLEGCRHSGVKHLVYASSSSIYGAAREMPLREDMVTDSPISLYAASKKANELMAHSYSHLYRIPASALRFFTVYGPWGRPDMAIFKFVRAIFEGKPIDVYNHGHLRRDFTYVDDVVDAVLAVAARPPQGEAGQVPHRVLNVGHNGPVPLMEFIAYLERACGREAIKNFLPMQAGDVPDTWADTSRLKREFGVRAATDLQTGAQRFVDWYRDHYGMTGR
ncbi:MAG: NAD-dependent epimerase/dehydratase family protein [Gemmobacter sp.]|nr:NAD-dependent epimerase/dehydratase family protein [Gemmobacter sp.]